MKRAELAGREAAFEVAEDYRTEISRLTRSELRDALVEEAELRGAWEQLAEQLAPAPAPEGRPAQPIERMRFVGAPGEDPYRLALMFEIPEPLLRASDQLTGREDEILAAALQGTLRRFLTEHLVRLKGRTAALEEALLDGHDWPLEPEPETETEPPLEDAVEAGGQNESEASPPAFSDPDAEPPSPAGEASPGGDSPASPEDPAAGEEESDELLDVVGALRAIGEPATTTGIARQLGQRFDSDGRVLNAKARRAVEAALEEALSEGKIRTAGTYRRGTLYELVAGPPTPPPAALEQRAPSSAEREQEATEALVEEVYRSLAHGSMLIPGIAVKLDRKPAEVAHAMQQLQKAGRAHKLPHGAYERIVEPA